MARGGRGSTGRRGAKQRKPKLRQAVATIPKDRTGEPSRGIHTRLIAPCHAEPAADEPEFDIGAFAERLFLFDSYVIESTRLTEIPALVAAFGYEGVCHLVESRVVIPYADAFSIAEGNFFGKQLPPSGFQLLHVRSAEPHLVSDWLRPIMRIPGLRYSEARRLKSLVGRYVRRAPPDAGQSTLANTALDVAHKTALGRAAMATELARVLGTAVRENDVECRITTEPEQVYLIESNLEERFGVDGATARAVGQKTLLAIAHLNHRIEWMNHFEGVAAFNDSDLQLYQLKLGLIAQLMDGTQQQTRLGRVLEIAGMPSLSDAARRGHLNFAKLLELRRSDEADAFRDWLARSDQQGEEELRKLFRGLEAQLAKAVHAPAGKALRVLLGTAIGAMLQGPVTAALGGTLVGLLDQFVWDRVLPRSGPWTFVDNGMKSLFEKD